MRWCDDAMMKTSSDLYNKSATTAVLNMGFLLLLLLALLAIIIIIKMIRYYLRRQRQDKYPSCLWRMA